MSSYLKEFKFEKPPLKITYFDEDPLKLNSEFIFFHNKSKFRKELNRLQYLFKTYTKIALHAAGIRDSYLNLEFSDDFLIVVFTTPEIIKKTNQIMEKPSNIELNPACYYIQTTSDYMLLLSKDMNGLILGITKMESILKQAIEDYLDKQKFDDYIKIPPFELLDCEST
jgi:hypothetical protein